MAKANQKLTTKAGTQAYLRQNYQVKPGDNPATIAQANNLTPEQLKQANPGAFPLVTGQNIKLPQGEAWDQARAQPVVLNTQVRAQQDVLNTQDVSDFNSRHPGTPLGNPTIPGITDWYNKVMSPSTSAPNAVGELVNAVGGMLKSNAPFHPYSYQSMTGYIAPGTPTPTTTPKVNPLTTPVVNALGQINHPAMAPRFSYLNNTTMIQTQTGPQPLAIDPSAMRQVSEQLGLTDVKAYAQSQGYAWFGGTYVYVGGEVNLPQSQSGQSGGWSSKSGYYMNTPGTKGNWSGTSVRNPHGNLVMNQARRRRQANRGDGYGNPQQGGQQASTPLDTGIGNATQGYTWRV